MVEYARLKVKDFTFQNGKMLLRKHKHMMREGKVGGYR